MGEIWFLGGLVGVVLSRAVRMTRGEDDLGGSYDRSTQGYQHTYVGCD